MRKVMAGMGLFGMPLLSLVVGAMPQLLLVIALLLGGGNLTAGITTIFTTLVAVGGIIGAIGAIGPILGG
mgnify:CR=1 FL=1